MNAVEPRHEVAASEILNTHTFGIVREDAGGPIEEVHGSQLAASIAHALAAAEARGRIEGLKIAADKVLAKRKLVADQAASAWPLIEVKAEIDARILQAEKDANA